MSSPGSSHHSGEESDGCRSWHDSGQQSDSEISAVGLVACYGDIHGVRAREVCDLGREDLSGIPKLEDAEYAATTQAEKCTLILTEGDSGKAFAMSGLGIIGRDYYGVYPLTGKFRNVNSITPAKSWENRVVKSIMQIMGLEYKKEYKDVNGLRYGHIMIMSDQDVDGSHIKGLIINLLHTYWPSLLKLKGFLQQFITPVIKICINDESHLFYSMTEYKLWNESIEGGAGNWTIKYYKGLGTNNLDETVKYFKNMEKHIRNFDWVDKEDSASIELAFGKSKVTSRKTWLEHGFEFPSYIDYGKRDIRLCDFVDKELRLYSMAHVHRTIPSMVDGLKPSQRKIMNSCFKRKLKEIKVTELIGHVLQDSAYLHGDQSLSPTIVGMAQEFVGTNNLNLLQPKGQFGTRRKLGKDAAKSRYISTGLSEITEVIFPKVDELLLKFLHENGKEVEPKWYVPVVPMVLINGCKGVGTGWNTFIPKFGPIDVANILRAIINDPMAELTLMIPWYRGFKGTFYSAHDQTFISTGVIERVDNNRFRITELPIGCSMEGYLKTLQSMLRSSKEKMGNVKGKKPEDITIEEIHDKKDMMNVDIEVIVTEENMKKTEGHDLVSLFKLKRSMSTRHMNLFNSDGKFTTYLSPEDIAYRFYLFRLPLYEQRKDAVEKKLIAQINQRENKIKFVSSFLKGEYIPTGKRNADEMLLYFKENGFEAIPEEGDDVGFNYLISLQIGHLTEYHVSQLKLEKETLQTEYDNIKTKQPSELWLADLDNFEKAVLKLYAKENPKKETGKVAEKTTTDTNNPAADLVHAQSTEETAKKSEVASKKRKHQEEEPTVEVAEEDGKQENDKSTKKKKFNDSGETPAADVDAGKKKKKNSKETPATDTDGKKKSKETPAADADSEKKEKKKRKFNDSGETPAADVDAGKKKKKSKETLAADADVKKNSTETKEIPAANADGEKKKRKEGKFNDSGETPAADVDAGADADGKKKSKQTKETPAADADGKKKKKKKGKFNDSGETPAADVDAGAEADGKKKSKETQETPPADADGKKKKKKKKKKKGKFKDSGETPAADVDAGKKKKESKETPAAVADGKKKKKKKKKKKGKFNDSGETPSADVDAGKKKKEESKETPATGGKKKSKDTNETPAADAAGEKKGKKKKKQLHGDRGDPYSRRRWREEENE